MTRNQHVVYCAGRWEVRAAGSRRATSVHGTQSKAIQAGQEIARHQGCTLYVHSKAGFVKAIFRHAVAC